MGRFRDHPQKVLSFIRAHGFPRRDRGSLPVLVVGRRLHERVRHPHAIIRILEKDRSIRFFGIIPLFNQGVGFLFFFGFAGDKLRNIWVIDVQQHHFCGASGFSARFDDAGKGIVAFHE